MRTATLSTKLRVDIQETGRLTQMVRQFGRRHQMPEETVFKISLSIDELITNIVLHGTDSEPQAHEIVLHLRISDGEVEARIEDDGRAFNPLELPVPDIEAPLSHRPLGGMGIHLVRTLMDQIHYRRIGQRNVLTLTKRVA